jgi:hypothetical protein
VVRRPAVWSRAEKTHEHDFLDTGTSCCFDNIPRSIDVHALKVLSINLTIDARAMGNGLTTIECGSQRLDVS